ncbi:MAG: carbon-nitrogen family hydrolase [Phycisphaerae bacterium]|nr:carbon-nitrogen family hydrolase [Phycisphaerae bacterium]
MRAHLIQLDIAWEDRPRNRARTRDLIGSAGVRPGDLVLLPEMFDTGFSFNLARTNDADGSTLAFLAGAAREWRVTLQGARTVIGPDGRGRNRASVLGPDGSLLVEYDKIHPFSFGKEAAHFSGGEVVVTYRWEGSGGATGDAAAVCPAICYDLRFPELFREGMRRGAEIFALGANWPAPRKLHRRALGIARAIENQAFMLCVNRSGRDPHLEYAGGSYAADPQGAILGELGEAEGVLSVDLDLGALREWRRTFPALRDAKLLGGPPGAPIAG